MPKRHVPFNAGELRYMIDHGYIDAREALYRLMAAEMTVGIGLGAAPAAQDVPQETITRVLSSHMTSVWGLAFPERYIPDMPGDLVDTSSMGCHLSEWGIDVPPLPRGWGKPLDERPLRAT